MNQVQLLLKLMQSRTSAQSRRKEMLTWVFSGLAGPFGKKDSDTILKYLSEDTENYIQQLRNAKITFKLSKYRKVKSAKPKARKFNAKK